MINKNYLFVIFNFIFSVLSAQVYYEGEFDIKEIRSFIDKNKENQDPNILTLSYVHAPASKVVFSQNKLVTVFIHNDSIYKRVVYDYENKQVYTFKYPQHHPRADWHHPCFEAMNELGIKNFEISKLENKRPSSLSEGVNYREYNFVKNEIFNGFNCQVIKSHDSSNNLYFWYTNEIKLPFLNISLSSPPKLDDSHFCVKYWTRLQDIEINHQIFNFVSPAINSQYLSTDTTGFIQKNEVDIIFQKVCESMESQSDRYSLGENVGRNTDKVINLLNEGLFFKSFYDDIDKSDFDQYYLTKTALALYESTEFFSLNILLLKTGVIDSTEFLLFNNILNKIKTKNINYKNILNIYIIKKVLNSKESRKLVVQGLEKSILRPGKMTPNVIKEYINEEAELPKLLLTYDDFYHVIPRYEITSKSELVTFIRDLFQNLLPQFNIETNYNKEHIIVKVNALNYSFSFQDFTNNYSSQTYRYLVDQNSYFTILKKMKQVLVDNGFNHSFSFISFIDLFPCYISSDEYSEIIALFPDLDFLSETHFIKKNSKTILEDSEPIKMSFKPIKGRYDYQLELNLRGDLDIDDFNSFLTTREKLEFFEVVSKHRKTIKMSSKQLNQLYTKLSNNFFADYDDLLSLLPIQVFSLNKFNLLNPFPVIKEGKSLQDNIRTLHYFLNGSIKPLNMAEITTGPHFLTFYHKGRKVGVSKTYDNRWLSLLHTLDIILDKEKNIGIYSFLVSTHVTNYYLFDLSFGDDLRKLFKTEYFRRI